MTTQAPGRPPDIPGLVFADRQWAGGYSDVFLFEQQMPRRKVAVKVLKTAGMTDSLRRQFTAEANAMAELADHPNIVPVFSAEIAADGRPYLVMMYYPRANLGVRAAAERFAVAEVLRIGIQISSAVETAHRAGILHRDIKPANILTSQFGVPGLTDFGIAAKVAAVDDDDDTGVSVPWSPPEVLYATAPATVASDVYALGATLWHLLVGRSPFEVPGGDNSPYALMRRVRDSPAPSTGRADVPTSLTRLLQQAMSKDPLARPGSALDFARALQAVEQEARLPRTDIVVLDEQVPEARSRMEEAGTEATRMRAPIRVDPQNAPRNRPRVGSQFAAPIAPPTPIAVASATTDQSPIKPDLDPPTISRPISVRPMPVLRGERVRTTAPQDQPAPATVHRPAIPQVVAEPEPRRRGVRIPVVAGIAGVAAILIVVLAVVFTSGHSKNNATKSSTTHSADVGNPDAVTPPGPVTVTATRVSKTTVRFTGTYSNPNATDTFVWRTTDGKQSKGSRTPSVDLTDPQGTKICVQVRVIQAGEAATILAPDANVGCYP